MGKGGTQQEAGTFGYNLAELQPMIDESMYLIPKIMTQEEIEHDGKYIKIPRPADPPQAAAKAAPAFVLRLHPRGDIGTCRQARHRRAGARFSRDPRRLRAKMPSIGNIFATVTSRTRLALCRPNTLPPSARPACWTIGERARRIGLRGQRFFAEAIGYWYQGGAKPSVEDLSAEEQAAALERDKQKTVAFLSEEKIPIGDEHTSNYTVAQDAYGNAMTAFAT